MSAPRSDYTTVSIQNPHASMPLVLPVLVVANTSDEELAHNISTNSRNYHEWLFLQKEHGVPAIMIGGGPSVEDHVEEIRALQAKGAHVFAMNGASKWARSKGIHVDYQVIVDAKEETRTLVDPEALEHYFASQCHPKTLEAAFNPTLWHLEIGNIERYFPEERVKKGGYVLLGGGAAVGNSALCVAFSQGYREMHIFGYDSCHRNGKSHAYEQPMNLLMPCTKVKWGGREFYASLAMKAQAEKFQFTGQGLVRAGCTLKLYGDGLLQTMWNTKKEDLTEQEKYQLIWQFDSYRKVSPGEETVGAFLEVVKPDSTIIDFGCGTGRAGLRMAEKGHTVLLTDFAENCRDEEALHLPFIQWDLTLPHPCRSKFGFCSDVMEHIPPKDVDVVIQNIMNASEIVMFRISTVEDAFGIGIEQELHLSIHPFEWWAEKFKNLGYEIQHGIGSAETGVAAFVIRNPISRGLS